MSGLNEPLAIPQASHPLTEMPPMEALYAAFAGGSGDPHHELTLDPAAMNIHDGDEVCVRPFISSEEILPMKETVGSRPITEWVATCLRGLQRQQCQS